MPPETMLQVLLWLDRFDLDGKQITSRRFRSLVENKQMPLRKVDRVEYDGNAHVYSDAPDKKSFRLKIDETARHVPANVEFQIGEFS